MGQKLSQTKESIVIKVFLEKYFPNFHLIQVLNNGMMYKTLLIKKDKAPLVVKIFVKKITTKMTIKYSISKRKKYYHFIKQFFQKKYHQVYPP